MGVSGVGKTTVATDVANELGWTCVEGDNFHSAANVAKMHGGTPLTDADRAPWLRAIAAWIGEREARGENAVVTCSALKRSYRDVLRDGHPSVRFVHLTAPVDVIAARMRERKGHFMPPQLLHSQEAALEPLGSDEPGMTVDASGTPEEVAAEVVRRLDRG